MPFALATAFLFALSAICGQRTTRLMPPMAANFVRLCLAAAALGVLTYFLFPGSVQPATFAWLFASGLIGFGMGDVALFLSYARIGARLTILINFCLAPVFSGLADWLWLGDAITLREAGAISLILAGVAIAIAPPKRRAEDIVAQPWALAGFFWAAVAGLGQGLGATVSRRATAEAARIGIEVSGLSQAFQRVLGGLLVALIVVAALHFAGRLFPKPDPLAPKNQGGSGNQTKSSKGTAALWLLGAACFGPIIGVSCYQWALMSLDSSAVVNAVIALSPILVIPLAWLSEGDKPTPRSVIGAATAAGGVAALALIR